MRQQPTIRLWWYQGPALLAGLAAIALSAGAAGCKAPTGRPAVAQAQDRVTALEAEVSSLSQRVANQQATIDSQRRQIITLQQMGTNRPVRLANLEGIRFARLSGGYDANNDGADDGVVLYVQPYDADGDTVKAAGELVVRLFDLSNPAAPKLIRQCTWNAEQLRKVWSGKLMTSHFTARCPWPDGLTPPRHVTAQAQFTDALTGGTFSQQQVLTISSPEPASR